MKHPFEPNPEVPTKMENVWAEYFQITLFLIIEHFRPNSFWQPFLDSLPSQNETFFTIKNSDSLRDEIQRQNDDIFNKVEYCRKVNIDCQTRFSPFIQKYVHKLAEWSQIPTLSHAAVMAQWDWAWMNLCTRCFGHYHVPNDLAMVPLMDMINHAPYQTKLQFFLKPH